MSEKPTRLEVKKTKYYEAAPSSPPPASSVKKKQKKGRLFLLILLTFLLWGYSQHFHPSSSVGEAVCVLSPWKNREKDEESLPRPRPTERTIFTSEEAKDNKRANTDSPSPSLPPSPKSSPNPAIQASYERLRTIRIAAWDLYPLDYAKVTNPQIGPRIAAVIAAFDLVAVSGFRANNRGVIDALLYQINQKGNHFNAAAVVDGKETEFHAFFFNTDRVSIDRETLAKISDPSGRLSIPPLAAAFCAANSSPAERFTFLLLSVRVAPKDIPLDPDILADLYKTVRSQSGRNGVREDDLILLGSLGVPMSQLGTVASIPGLVSVAANLPTDRRGNAVDYIIFDQQAVSEYVERFGVVHPAKHLKISEQEEKVLANHFPIWADFSIYENLE